MQFYYAGENMSICSFRTLRRTCLVPSYPLHHQILKLVPQEIIPCEKKNTVMINHQLDTVLAERFEIVREEKIQRAQTHW